MVTFLQRPVSNKERFAQAFSNLGQTASQLIPEEILGRQERTSLGGLVGEDFSKIRNPDFQKMILNQALQRRAQEEGTSASSAKEEQDYQQIKNAFGEQFANVWKASPVGARTALENAALQQGLRKLPIGGLFGEEAEVSKERAPGKSNTVKTPSGKEFALPEIPQPEGQTPAENIKYKRELRNDNKPIFKENVDKFKALKDTSSRLDLLESFNEDIPEGISRLLIDAKGNVRPTALRFKAVPKSVEKFTKTVNDFLSSAKDMFGGRVTNYDIEQFKARLPGLLNSKEGRREIIQQMKMFNKMESNYRKALKSIYQHYGLDGIPQEDAERLAEEMVGDEEESLREQLLQIGRDENELEEMPDAASHKGKIIEDDEGNRFRSNGIEWEQL